MRNNNYTATSIVYKVYQLLEIISVYSAVIMYIIICNNVLFSQFGEFWNAGIVKPAIDGRPSGKMSECIVYIFITPFLFVRKTVSLLSFLHQNTHKILVSFGFLDYVVLHDTIIYEYITQNSVKFLN